MYEHASMISHMIASFRSSWVQNMYITNVDYWTFYIKYLKILYCKFECNLEIILINTFNCRATQTIYTFKSTHSINLQTVCTTYTCASCAHITLTSLPLHLPASSHSTPPTIPSHLDVPTSRELHFRAYQNLFTVCQICTLTPYPLIRSIARAIVLEAVYIIYILHVHSSTP